MSKKQEAVACLLSYLLTVTMIFSLSACSQANDSTTRDTGENQSQFAGNARESANDKGEVPAENGYSMVDYEAGLNFPEKGGSYEYYSYGYHWSTTTVLDYTYTVSEQSSEKIRIDFEFSCRADYLGENASDTSLGFYIGAYDALGEKIDDAFVNIQCVAVGDVVSDTYTLLLDKADAAKGIQLKFEGNKPDADGSVSETVHEEPTDSWKVPDFSATTTFDCAEYLAPANWRLRNDLENNRKYYFATANNADGYILIKCVQAEELTADNIRDQDLQQLIFNGYIDSFASDGGVVTETEYSVLVNNPCVVIKSEYEINARTYTAKTYFTLVPGHIFTASIIGPEALSAEYESAIDMLMSTVSFKIDDGNPEQTTSAEVSAGGLRPEFKEAMDSYEAFYDEYCEFMENFQNNSSDLTLLMEYANMMSKVVEMDEKFEAWGEEELNDAELAYYLEVSNRIAQKLLAVAS